MAKKSKTDALAAGKSSKTKSGGKSTSRKRSSSAKKPARTVEPEAMPIGVIAFDPTEDQIQMRAYFISERRRRFDLPGDANSDWLEAKRQLLSETRH